VNIVLGVTGSISAYKAVDIMRLFQKNGHSVKVILTRSAQQFITALPFETFCPGNVFTDMFEKHQDPLTHINVAKDGDLLLIAPASANIIGKMANGIADDLLSSTYLAFYRNVVIAPAMNTYMFDHPAVQDNLARLKVRGVGVLEPDVGSLACKAEGKGKLPDPQHIYDFCIKFITGAIDV
jgi:phosphopantothenoylcysteine decarboxylase / phosphopantothenate---cysteine ligase